MKCPKCPNKAFHDTDGYYCICGWREPIEPFPDALEGGIRPATHAYKTIDKYNELKRLARKK